MLEVRSTQLSHTLVELARIGHVPTVIPLRASIRLTQDSQVNAGEDITLVPEGMLSPLVLIFGLPILVGEGTTDEPPVEVRPHESPQPSTDTIRRAAVVLSDMAQPTHSNELNPLILMPLGLSVYSLLHLPFALV